MAIYSYICDDCGKEVEVSQPMTATRIYPFCPCNDKAMRRNYQAEQSQRCGELPDWISQNAGVTTGRILDANKHYANMGVKFDSRGYAHVPGKVRNKFLKERGMVDL